MFDLDLVRRIDSRITCLIFFSYFLDKEVTKSFQWIFSGSGWQFGYTFSLE